MNPVQIVIQVFKKKRIASGVFIKQRRAVLFSFLLFAGVPLIYSCFVGENSWNAMAHSRKVVRFYYPEMSKYTVVVETSYGQLEMNLDAAVSCRLSAVIPAEYEEEAIKAQAVLIRTELIQKYKEAQNTQKNTPYYIYIEENPRLKNYFTFLEQKRYFGENYQKNLEKYRRAAVETTGMYLKKTDGADAETINTSWFRVSTGNTREGVLCKNDYLSENYYNDVLLTRTEFQNVMQKLFALYTEESAENIGKEITEIHFEKFVEKDISCERSLQFGVHLRDGTKQELIVDAKLFCDMFQLLSPYVETVAETGREVIITVKGIGHGVGMSQFTANEMAKEGKDYTEILNYFFTNIAIDKFE